MKLPVIAIRPALLYLAALLLVVALWIVALVRARPLPGPLASPASPLRGAGLPSRLERRLSELRWTALAFALRAGVVAGDALGLVLVPPLAFLLRTWVSAAAVLFPVVARAAIRDVGPFDLVRTFVRCSADDEIATARARRIDQAVLEGLRDLDLSR